MMSGANLSMVGGILAKEVKEASGGPSVFGSEYSIQTAVDGFYGVVAMTREVVSRIDAIQARLVGPSAACSQDASPAIGDGQVGILLSQHDDLRRLLGDAMGALSRIEAGL